MEEKAELFTGATINCVCYNRQSYGMDKCNKMNLTDYKEILTPKEVADYLQISRSGVYTLLRSEAINSFRVGKKIRIPKASLEEYVQSQIISSHTYHTGGQK